MEYKDYEKVKGLLREKLSNADLTTHFGYKLDVRRKELTMMISTKGLGDNMQSDAAAFESWAIVLKCYLHEYINTVIINWETDISENRHFNRFVYRLAKFVQTYSWAYSARQLPAIPSILKCNVSNQEAAHISEHTKDHEGWLECKYVSDHQSEYDVMDHQFPVGIFDYVVSRKTHFTTGGKSAIDIWAIKNDELSIFELKLPDNKPLGIISELMFYTNIIDDLLNHNITFDDGKKLDQAIKNDYRGFAKFFEAYNTGVIKKINSVMLADNLHTLITDDVLQLMNESPRWKYKNIMFIKKTVSMA